MIVCRMITANADSSLRKRTCLRRIVSPALLEDVTVTNKVSQNLHAELLLHDLGATVLEEGSTVAGCAGGEGVSGEMPGLIRMILFSLMGRG